MRALLRALLILSAVLTVGAPLVGCGTTSVPAVSDTTIVAPTSAALPVLRLRIPAIGVDATLEVLERDEDGVLQPPPVTAPDVVGYYGDGVAPGDAGPALIAGHVSGRPDGATESVPGVFAKLATLTDGDTIVIARDGEPLTFTVYRTESFPKAEFPTAEVYSDTAGPELRLVTCGGLFDSVAHHYEDNTVVFARLAA